MPTDTTPAHMLDVKALPHHEVGGLTLILQFGAQQMPIRLTPAKRWELIQVLTGAADHCALPVEDFHCQPLPTKGCRYLEVTPDVLNARKAEL